MITIYNRIIPFNGYIAINLFGILFVRKGKQLTQIMLLHELIHTALMKELLYIPFYLWYIIECIILLFVYMNFDKAYYNIRFEKEAYKYQDAPDYLKNRKHYCYLHKDIIN